MKNNELSFNKTNFANLKKERDMLKITLQYITEENEQELKEPKKKIERPKLDAKALLYNRDSGLRKYYEVITTTEFKNKDVTKNLDKLISITRR